jgi:hypothetical protein
MDLSNPSCWISDEAIALVLDIGVRTAYDSRRTGKYPSVNVGKRTLVAKVGFAQWLYVSSIAASIDDARGMIERAEARVAAGEKPKADLPAGPSRAEAIQQSVDAYTTSCAKTDAIEAALKGAA